MITATKSVKKVIKNESLHRVFRRMIGVDEINPDLITSKFDNMKSHMISFMAFITNLSDAEMIEEKLEAFIKNSNLELDGLHIPSNEGKMVADLRQINKIVNDAERIKALQEFMQTVKYDPEQLKTAYNALINTELFKCMIFFTDKYTKILKIQKAGGFTGTEFVPSVLIKQPKVILLNCVETDFKRFFMSDDTELINYITRWLSCVYGVCKNILDEHCKPNIRADEYVEVIKESVGLARKQVSRCDDAFNMMERMLDHFTLQFPVYYKRFVISGNPYIILEYYIKDVAEQVKESSAAIKHQFKTIIGHFTKRMNEIPKDNKDIREIFDLAGALDLED